MKEVILFKIELFIKLLHGEFNNELTKNNSYY